MKKKLHIEKFIDASVKWIKEYAEKSDIKGFVLGVSGGIDSAVVSTLCARTGLPVLCIEMPIHQEVSQTNRSTDHINWLKSNNPKVHSISIDLTDTFDTMVRSFRNAGEECANENKLAEANTRSRLRMTTIYYYANSLRYLVAGTGNKVEDFGVGFFTKGGDGLVDFSSIGDITKTEVWDIARALGINKEIIEAVPTDGLWENSPSDEELIGASYAELEWAMQFFEDNIVPRGEGVMNSSINTILALVGKQEVDDIERKKEVMNIFLTRHRANQHKMVPIPIFNSINFRESTTND